jgi:hypothetical protein
MRSFLQGAVQIPGRLKVAGAAGHGAENRAGIARVDFQVEVVALPVEGEHPAVGKELK